MEHKFDIKTLKTIHTLCACGSVMQTAKLLGVSPGAVSYTLNKARKITGSALFFRTRTGMVPGSLAEELSQKYQKIVRDLDLDNVLSATEKTIFTVSCYSVLELLLSTALIACADPLSRVNFCSSVENDEARIARIRNKEVDIDIGTRLPVNNSIIQLKFFHSGISAIVRHDHPAIGDTFTLSDWTQHQHAIWSRGMHLISDNVEQTNRFNALFQSRNVAFVASSTLNLVMLCAHSDLIILLPTVIAQHLQPLLPIKVLDVPPELEMTYECYVHYHHSLATNPQLGELIQHFQAAVS
ncbi:LysR family transcriptional regulator [Leclercia adecarboxylata]|uniref:LysR family transcriptional regulator n=1 Tax=Leclercia adecarboxylata TaxID=83655 RepID=UPI002DBF5E08|nr:LysR family transcriptional regulator [Leclercia adecarboxylata]MEB6377846.1 LysR family transcriptional regulator [Leclercia adecarboxylata]